MRTVKISDFVFRLVNFLLKMVGIFVSSYENWCLDFTTEHVSSTTFLFSVLIVTMLVRRKNFFIVNFCLLVFKDLMTVTYDFHFTITVLESMYVFLR